MLLRREGLLPAMLRVHTRSYWSRKILFVLWFVHAGQALRALMRVRRVMHGAHAMRLERHGVVIAVRHLLRGLLVVQLGEMVGRGGVRLCDYEGSARTDGTRARRTECARTGRVGAGRAPGMLPHQFCTTHGVGGAQTQQRCRYRAAWYCGRPMGGGRRCQ